MEANVDVAKVPLYGVVAEVSTVISSVVEGELLPDDCTLFDSSKN